MIFGIGLGRTGTMSLAEAMTILGYRSGHYLPIYTSLNTLHEKYDFVCDTPIPNYVDELEQLYPDALWILTVRPLKDWLASWKKFDASKTFHRTDIEKDHVKMHRIMTFGQETFNPDIWADTYLSHNSKIISHFPPEKLLILALPFDWRPLCEFLGKRVPDIDFPHYINR